MMRFVPGGFRWTVLLLVVCSSAYAVVQGVHRTNWYRGWLYKQLTGDDADRRTNAAVALARLKAEGELLMALQLESAGVRDVAQRALEHIWFNQAGEEAYELTQDAYAAAKNEELSEALWILDRVTEKYSEYAEGWNRRGAVYWEMGEYEKSIADCERALSLNPAHYGAWQGIGICQLELGQIAEACESLRKALRITPYDEVTRRSLRRCENLLRIYPHPTAETSGMLLI